MKKLLLLVGGVVLIAAACNTVPQTTQTPTPTPTPPTNSTSQSGVSVDDALNDLNASIDAEQKINFQSDDDVVSSDQEIVSGYEGVSNANY